jgi:hypothetical protein
VAIIFSVTQPVSTQQEAVFCNNAVCITLLTAANIVVIVSVDHAFRAIGAIIKW